MRFPKAGTIARLIIPLLLAYGILLLAEALERNTELKELYASLQQQAESIERENGRLRQEIASADNDEVIAAVARERFGLVLPDEKVFYDPDP